MGTINRGEEGEILNRTVLFLPIPVFLESDTFCFLVPAVLVKITHKQGMFGAAQHGYGFCLFFLCICLFFYAFNSISMCLWRVSVCSEGAEKDIIPFNDCPASHGCIYPTVPPGSLGTQWLS